MESLIVKNAHANNLKNINVTIKDNSLTVLVGPSGSGKSSFAFDTLVKKEKCQIESYPKSVICVSQKIFNTGDKLDEISNIINKRDQLIIIDEPLAGTTEEEALKFSKIIKSFSNKNMVVVVEHRREILEFADTILVFGPGSGKSGGYITKELSPKEYIDSLPIIDVKRDKNKSNKKITALYKEFNGIKDYKVSFNVNTITSITGPSKCGKSTYLDAIFKSLDKSVNASMGRKNLIEVKNKNYIRRPHIIDAKPVAKNSKSTVVTYYGVSKFFKDKDIDITIKEALEIYKDDMLIVRRLNYLKEVGLDYLKLNQSSYSLSGGECQRIKLAKLLCKKLGDRSVYIFDNPVRGLGIENVSQVMEMFDHLVKNNNTVLIAENDPTALKYVDCIINL